MNLQDRQNVEAMRGIEAFCAATGLEVVIKPFQFSANPFSFLTPERRLHRSTFCLRIKETATEACRQCDLRDVPARCQRVKKPFIHVCHAGASELILPIFVERKLVGVCYVGQFRPGKQGPAELPQLKPADRRRLMGLGILLLGYLKSQVRAPNPPATQLPESYRGDLIRSFLQRELRANPGIPEVARHLGVSISRASHLVRETTGQSFTALRDSLRQERARELLVQTYFPIRQVADECGFSDPQYFHRFFRRQTGITPGQFRQAQRAEA